MKVIKINVVKQCKIVNICIIIIDLSYFNPYVLIALAAAAIPVIIHLLNLQKVEKIEFSSLMLLKEIQKSRFRKIRVRQFLLMLVRALIIVFLVLAFADPYLKTITGSGADIRKNAVVFTDSSYSMNVYQDTLPLIQTASNISDYVNTLFSTSDKVTNIYTSVSTGGEGKINFKPDINSILAAAVEKKDGKKNDEIFIISDFQNVNFDRPVRDFSNELSDTYFYLLNVSDKVYANVSVNSVYQETEIPGPGRKIKLKAAINNEGSNYVRDVRVALNTGGKVNSEYFINLNPAERKLVDFEFVPEKNGNNEGYVVIEGLNQYDNSLREDDKFLFNVFIPEKIKIGILKSPGSDSKYIISVFDAANGGNKQGGVIFDYSIIGGVSSIDSYDVIFLLGYEPAGNNEMDKLREYLNTGKGIYVFPDENFNGSFLTKLGSVSFSDKKNIGKIEKISEVKTFEPFFEGIFKGKQVDENTFPPVKFYSRYGIIGSGNSYPLISAVNLAPLVYMDRTNYGMLLVSSVSADERMSDFPVNEIFSPLILRSAVYLSYSALASERHQEVINHDTLESNTARADRKKLTEILNRCGVKNYEIVEKDEIGDLRNLVEGNRKGKSLWMFSVLIVILLVIAEMILVKKVYGNKNGFI